MNKLDRNFENKKLSEELWQSYDEDGLKKRLSEIEEQKKSSKKEQGEQAKRMVAQLLEDGNKKEDSVDAEKREKVQAFIREKCSEPIDGINNIVPYRTLVDVLLKWVEAEIREAVKKSILGGEKITNIYKLEAVKKSILKGDAKNENIYKLEAYQKLLNKWFIIPSDNRSYKDEQYHLWVDYNVVEGTKVKSMYKWKVVASWLDGWLWHRVIIEHEMEDWTKFYSLYAHLASEGLPSVGADVEQGMIIWEVWKAFTEENGDWEEHLHFQIMENADSPKWYSENEWIWNYDVLESFGKK